MKIGILTFGRPKSLEAEPPYETKRLLEAAETRGHEAKIFCEPFFSFRQNNGRLEIFYDNEPLPPIDVFIARTNFMEDQISNVEMANKQGVIDAAARAKKIDGVTTKNTVTVFSGKPGGAGE